MPSAAANHTPTRSHALPGFHGNCRRAAQAADLVVFSLGCSFTFEWALMASGVPMRHIEDRKTVPTFRTGIEVPPDDVFSVGIVVGMRPIPQRRVDLIMGLCRNFPFVHSPLFHLGNPGEICVNNLNRPDWCAPLEIHASEIPSLLGVRSDDFSRSENCAVTNRNCASSGRYTHYRHS